MCTYKLLRAVGPGYSTVDTYVSEQAAAAAFLAVTGCDLLITDIVSDLRQGCVVEAKSDFGDIYVVRPTATFVTREEEAR